MTKETITKLIEICNTNAKEAGWWKEQNNYAEKYALMHSEVSEAYEGVGRPNLMDNKLKHRFAQEAELADTLIRVFDYMGHRDYPYESDAYFYDYNYENPYKAYCIFHETLSSGLECLRIEDTGGELIHSRIVPNMGDFRIFGIGIIKMYVIDHTLFELGMRDARVNYEPTEQGLNESKRAFLETLDLNLEKVLELYKKSS